MSDATNTEMIRLSDALAAANARVAELEARIMEADTQEPVAMVVHHNPPFGVVYKVEWYTKYRDLPDGTKLYAGSAPVPAAVAEAKVPEVMVPPTGSHDNMMQTFANGWNACRSAMLAAKTKEGVKEYLTTTGQADVSVEIFPGTRDAINKLSVLPSEDKP